MSIDTESPLRPSKEVLDFLKSGMRMAPIILILTSPVLASSYVAGEEFFGYYLLGVGGLITYLAQLKATGELTSPSEETESSVLQFIAEMLIILYYNLVIFVLIIGASALQISGNLELAVLFAILYPAYDFEMVKLYAPFSIAGMTFFLLAVTAAFILTLERLLGWVAGREVLSVIQKWFKSDESKTTVILDGLVGIQRTIGGLVSKPAPR